MATHAVAGHIAVEAGFRKVINLVVDNYAQHFNAVPGAINAVQAGALGAAYAKLGYQTVLAGHWADRRSVEGIHTDTARRMKRIHNKAVRRLVISIGGAGAQATFVIELLAALQPGMAAKTWHVVLNCGDAKETQARVPNPDPNPDPNPNPNPSTNPNPNPNPNLPFVHVHVRERRHRLDVGAGREGLAAATRDDDGADLGVRVQLLRRGHQLLCQCRRQRIQLLLAVERDEPDAARPPLGQDLLVRGAAADAPACPGGRPPGREPRRRNAVHAGSR